MDISDPEFINAAQRIEAPYAKHPDRYPARTTHCDPLGLARWNTDYLTLREAGHGHEDAIRTVESRIAAEMGDENPWADPAPQPTLAPVIIVSGTSFLDALTGQYWPWRLVSAFRLLQFWMDDEMAKFDAYTAWVRRNRIHGVRMFGMYNGGIGRFIPTEYPHFWDDLDTCLTALGNMGLACEVTMGADLQTDALRQINLAAHYAQAREVLARHRQTVLEGVNEPFKNLPDGFDLAALMRADPRLLQATGAYDAADTGGYDFPTLDYISDHTPRDEEWPRKGKRLWETAQEKKKPCVGDEPFGIGRVVPGGSSSRSLVASDHAQYHAVCALMGAGSTIHSTFGLETRLPDAEEQACVDAITQTWDKIPAEAHLWQYTRGGEANCPLEDDGLRTYAMIGGDGAVAVRVRATKPAVARPGWRIVKQDGYQGCVAHCERA